MLYIQLNTNNSSYVIRPTLVPKEAGGKYPQRSQACPARLDGTPAQPY